MVCAPVRSIIPSLKLGDYLSVQAHKPRSIPHLTKNIKPRFCKFVKGNRTAVVSLIFETHAKVSHVFWSKSLFRIIKSHDVE